MIVPFRGGPWWAKLQRAPRRGRPDEGAEAGRLKEAPASVGGSTGRSLGEREPLWKEMPELLDRSGDLEPSAERGLWAEQAVGAQDAISAALVQHGSIAARRQGEMESDPAQPRLWCARRVG